MKTKLRISFSLLFLWLTITGCESSFDTEVCTEENTFSIDLKFVEGLSSKECGLLDAPRGQNYLVIIKSRSELEKNLRCFSEFQGVDFNNYFIIAGQYAHSSCILFDSQVMRICQNKIIHDVTLQEQVCQAPTDIPYFAVIEKRYQDFELITNIKFKDQRP